MLKNIYYPLKLQYNTFEIQTRKKGGQYMEFGEILRALREERRLSQSELAKVLNVSNVAISHYERGAREPNNEMLKKVSQYFNVSIDYLLGKNVPKWATDEDLIIFDEALKRNGVAMTYNGVELSEEDKIKLDAMIKAMLWERIKDNKKGGF